MGGGTEGSREVGVEGGWDAAIEKQNISGLFAFTSAGNIIAKMLSHIQSRRL